MKWNELDIAIVLVVIAAVLFLFPSEALLGVRYGVGAGVAWVAGLFFLLGGGMK